MSTVKTLSRPTQSILGIGYDLILSGSETGGQYELMRFVVPPHAGPPPHIHRREDECFHLRMGTLTIVVGDQRYSAVAGDSVHMPKGVPHTFLNESDEFAEFLCWVHPATLEGFFAAFATEWPADQPLPPPPNDADIQKLMQAAAKYEIEMLLG